MRLIDADNIKEKILAYWGCDPSYYEGTEADRDAYTLSRLEITPTIEAIPLSFIREEIERLDKCNLTELADYMRNVLIYYDAVQKGEETW